MTRDFQFTDLPLDVLGGYEIAPVNGTAAISYRLNGEWHIDGLWLDGFKVGEKPKSVEIDHGTPIYLMIYDRLEHAWRDRIEDFVSQCLAEDRETGRESRAALRAPVLEAAE